MPHTIAFEARRQKTVPDPYYREETEALEGASCKKVVNLEGVVDNMKSLSFQIEIFEELLREDGILVMGKGLGLKKILAKFMRLYCTPHRLVFVLNAASEFLTFRRMLLLDGVPEKELPKLITNEFTISDRERMYLEGGCFVITSRILVVDLLMRKVDPKLISGILVHNAHRVTETSTETFIIRLFRQLNTAGFIKAFSDEPESLVSGFNKIEKVLKHLQVRRLFLYPRFHAAISDCFASLQPEVVELSQPLTSNMQEMQQAILVAMDACISELKKSKQIDTSELTVENGLHKSFDVYIRRQLDPIWHKVTPKTKQLVNDLKVLRKLLSYLVRYDAITLYSFLIMLKASNSSMQRSMSLWLLTEAADRLFKFAKERIYKLSYYMKKEESKTQSRQDNGEADSVELEDRKMDLVLEENPKWKLVAEVLDEIYETYEKEKKGHCPYPGGCRVLVMVHDDRTAAQLREYLQLGGRGMLRFRFSRFLKQYNRKFHRSNSLRQAHAQQLKRKTEFHEPWQDSSLTLEQRLLLKLETQLADFLLKRDLEVDKPSIVAASSNKKRKVGSGPKPNGDQTGSALSRSGSLQSDSEFHSEKKTMEAQHEEFFSSLASYGLSMEELEEFSLSQAPASLSAAILLPQKEEIEDTGEAASEDPVSQFRREFVHAEDVNSLHVVLMSYGQMEQSTSVLEDFLPTFVVLYDPEISFIRELEVYKAEHPEVPLRVYFLIYEESVEEQKYLTEIRREKEAFESLIQLKKHMIVPNISPAPTFSPAGPPPLSMDTRTSRPAKSKPKAPPTIVIDVREFRSPLPFLLHLAGFEVHPVTLEVGDLILSPEICVERKSVSDLFSSFASGRLYNQVENMSRYYKTPCLLIEFTPEKAFSLQTPSELPPDISPSSISSKLVLLTSHFPALRIIWSRSPHASVDLIKMLKTNQDEPDLETAMTVGTEDGTAGGGSAAQQYNLIPMDVLRKFPGVTTHNLRPIMNKLNNLAELATASEEEIIKVMGKVNAKPLLRFLQKRE